MTIPIAAAEASAPTASRRNRLLSLGSFALGSSVMLVGFVGVSIATMGASDPEPLTAADLRALLALFGTAVAGMSVGHLSGTLLFALAKRGAARIALSWSRTATAGMVTAALVLIAIVAAPDNFVVVDPSSIVAIATILTFTAVISLAVTLIAESASSRRLLTLR